jgi:hypothetical protein
MRIFCSHGWAPRLHLRSAMQRKSGMWGTAAAGLAMLELAMVGIGCGGGGGGSASPPPDASVVTNVPAVNVSGGTATSPGGQGQPGGTVHLMASGDITIDAPAQAVMSMPAAVMAATPQVPADATTIDAAALAADVSAPGNAVISGDVTASGGEAVRTISAAGDLYVTGTLRAGDLGGNRQGLDLKATGTIYVSGSVDASGAADTGQGGGTLHLSANQIVIAGKLLASGGDGDSAGGAAGAVTIASTGDVNVSGSISLRGGAATGISAGAAQGGAAATLTIDAKGAVDIGGTVDVRGGSATSKSGGGAVVAGTAGALAIGETTAPATITIHVPVTVTGGAGDASGGAGGSVTLEPDTGTITVNGARAIDVSGGAAGSAPGAGGLITGSARNWTSAGGLHVSGEMSANGGSISKGGNGNGADAGRIDFELKATDGAVAVDQSARVNANGGASIGGVAGGGGHVWMFTLDGDLTIAGTVSTRGGDGTEGGNGGLGGMIYLFSDDNHNATSVEKGNLLIAPTGVLDSSGGDGATGGDARSNHGDGVAPFPEEQETFAIFLNCDGAHGETLNWMQNQGKLIARGGVHNGNGGDITYHGIGPGQLHDPTDGSGNHHPPPGNQDMSGDGTGQAGDYGGE